LLQTQDLPPIYAENSCLYLFTRENLLRKRTRIGDRPYLFEISALEAQDIDEEQDFLIADLLMKYRLRNELL
jgi:CMP-N-acetylneuraminic acid synthetase